MKILLGNQLSLFLLQNSQIRRSQNVQILAFILLLVTNLLSTLVNYILGFHHNRKMILNVHEDNECVSNLNVILRTETRHNSAGDLKVPFVTNVSEVLISDIVIFICALRRRIKY
jgi:hypothetical protein